ncbi:hypothetical protein B0I27_10856 [Arcticibacter pallidicorallinus]|uniref:Uncharacterized protein n=1 Tax=Arcticibacter pallidicorallinus TaxID=1259464 RepID=A0A2T0TYY4_9SPHI|nr:hypothetical protein [Arcticibacter pallidicorallinus]PRY50850.1 hypothetical protein B0I27_10856 [Arcticibacter pallidicorallinus]
MEEPFEITYSSGDTSFVLAVYRSLENQESKWRYTIVIDEVSLGVLVKHDNSSWAWESGGKEGPNHGGVNLYPDSASRIGELIDQHEVQGQKPD